MLGAASIKVVPCSTRHAYLGPGMADQPVDLYIVETTVGAIKRRGDKRVGLLAMPSRQKILRSVVQAVKAGRTDKHIGEQMDKLLAGLAQSGVRTVVAGCTEISTSLDLVGPSELTDSVVNPAPEQALHTIERAVRP